MVAPYISEDLMIETLVSNGLFLQADDILRFEAVSVRLVFLFFFQAEDGIRDVAVTGVQTCALPIFLRLPDPHVLELGVVHHVQRSPEFARNRLGRHRLARPGWSGEQEREPLRLLQDLLEPPAAVHEAFVAEFRERVEQSFPGRLREDDVFERETRLDRLGHGSRRLMDVGLRRLPIVVGLVDLDAGIEEAEDSANVIPGDVAARLADPAALRALHNPFLPVLFAHPQSSEASRRRPRQVLGAQTLAWLFKHRPSAGVPVPATRGTRGSFAPPSRNCERRPPRCSRRAARAASTAPRRRRGGTTGCARPRGTPGPAPRS